MSDISFHGILIVGVQMTGSEALVNQKEAPICHMSKMNQ